MFDIFNIPALLRKIDRKVDQIMTALQTATEELRALKAQVARNRTEVLAKIAALEAAAGGNTTPEFDTALAELKTEVQGSDDDVVPTV